ncbi:ABC transporter ATP-binding protein [Tritonibacter mobilis]|uniref:ABC transporter ATP-binding protein n=1 Tax=Tritonibacter mobilis TaxID=379347 RepID=UPI0008069F58|nr:ABC transporter ATP-binding protein [Tritonibacter mobilis]GLP88875.1 ABC transporter ATP-binding protein [Tritonibacter mobilis]SDX69822.1 peptide/nickel transport system ATP-binding protein [Tritonibacter mobilis]
MSPDPSPLSPPDTGDQGRDILSLRDFRLRFRGQPVPTVNGIDLKVAAGEILCIVGESGCGKSVTAMSIMGLLPPRSSEVLSGSLDFLGKSYDLRHENLPAGQRGNQIAMIFQEPMTSLNPSFTVGNQIAESVLQHQGGSRAEAMERAHDMLVKVGIPAPRQRLNEYPYQLSGGMRQRVMIAMALANDPKLLIADEPTTALDVTIQAQILDLIRDLRRETGMGTMMITHDLGVVAEIADSVAVMYGGEVVEYGPVTEIFDNPQHPYTIGLMSAMPRLDQPGGRLAIVPGSVPSMANMPSGCRFRSRCAFAHARCADPAPKVEAAPGHSVACHFAPLEQNLAVTA